MTRLFKTMWAKLERKADGLYLPLYVHMIDTLNAANFIWEHRVSDGLKRVLAGSISALNAHKELGDADPKKLFLFLAAAHDVGKATPVFQAKAALSDNKYFFETLVSSMREEGAVLKEPSEYIDSNRTPHAFASQVILKELGADGSIAVILGAHHGKPCSREQYNHEKTSSRKSHYGRDVPSEVSSAQRTAWEGVQKEAVEFAMSSAGYKSLADLPKANMLAQVIYTGLLIMADWIASNTHYFPMIPYCDNPVIAEEQIIDFEMRAKEAFYRLNMPPTWNPSSGWAADDFFEDRFSFNPNGMQAAFMSAVKQCKTPGLFLLEAPMGGGKTEAALGAAEILAQMTGRNGIFFALPTQATSNGIFPRVLEWMKKIDDEDHTVRLAHGKAEFNSDYCDLFSDYDEGDSHIYSDGGKAVVHSWFEGSKKALLADFVVGTIDQVLLLALKQKHVMLRHLGLANKVVIIDECHAYDAYMSAYLGRALRWLGEAGVPVILLSATLPYEKRLAFISSYLGVKIKGEIEETSIATKPQIFAKKQESSAFECQIFKKDLSYPKLSYTDGKNAHQIALPKREEKIQVEIGNLDEALLVKKLREKLSSGGCAGIIVNTVKRSQQLYKTLIDARNEHVELDGLELILFHSAFIASQRFEKESELLAKLGKPVPNDNRPHKIVVIGTQVLEQSLDIDFDFMISDLAPADLLLQRMGRLHRHKRNNRPLCTKTPEFLVMGMVSKDIKEFDRGSSFVYGDYLLYRTQASIEKKLNVTLPNDIPDIVELVYGNDKLCISEELEFDLDAARKKHEERGKDKEQRARAYRVAGPDHVSGLISWLNTDVGAISDIQASQSVRDGTMGIEVLVFQRKLDDRVCFLPWANEGQEISLLEIPNADLAKKMARERIVLPSALCAPYVVDSIIKDLEIKAKPFSEWSLSKWLSNELYLLLDEEGRCTIGEYILEYDKSIGLSYTKIVE